MLARSGGASLPARESDPGGDVKPLQHTASLSLLFKAGERPTTGEIAVLLSCPAEGAAPARISHHPGDENGWLELLASGLSFHLAGLAPAAPLAFPPVHRAYGLPADVDRFEFEAIGLGPGEHIAAGVGMLPVVRILTGLAANLASHLPVAAVCWNSAGSWMEPRYFSRLIVNWLAGGPFPALGLTSFRRVGDGGVETIGLDFFLGQEIRIAPSRQERESDLTRLASRIITDMIAHGPFHRREEIRNEGGEILLAEPSADKRVVTISRGM